MSLDAGPSAPTARRTRPRRLLAALALVALLAAVLVFSADQQETREGRLDGLRRATDLTVQHRAGPIGYPGYPARPPMGGDHSGLPQQCGVYAQQVPAEHVVHSLEHGAVWITYRPDLPEEDLAALRGLTEASTHRLLSPLPGQESPVVLTAWGAQLELPDADDDRLEPFLAQFTRSPQSPEPGAPCQGNARTGPLPYDPPGTDAPETAQA